MNKYKTHFETCTKHGKINGQVSCYKILKYLVKILRYDQIFVQVWKVVVIECPRLGYSLKSIHSTFIQTSCQGVFMTSR